MNDKNLKAMKSKRRKKRMLLFLCLMCAPSIFILLDSWDWLIKTLQVDFNSYGTTFYLVIFLFGLLLIATFIIFILRPAKARQKFKIFLKAGSTALLFAWAVVLVLILIYFVWWNFV